MKKLFKLCLLLLALALISCFEYTPTESTELTESAEPEREEWIAISIGQVTPSSDECAGKQSKLIIADLRQDGITRVYCLVDLHLIPYSSIFEFSYINNLWTKTRIDRDGLNFNSIAIGRCKNDGILRLYGVSSNKVSEFNFIYDQWTIQDISSFSGRNLAIGDPTNDGFESLYMSESDGIYEISFQNMVWESTLVGTVINSSVMSVGNGRGDGNESIYISNSKTEVFEFRYENGSWKQSSLGQLLSPSPYGENSKNSNVVEVTNTHYGQPAVYASAASELFEFFYDNDQWTKIKLGFELGLCQIRGGIGRNDGINRLYCSAYFDVLAEYTLVGGAWTKSSQAKTGESTALNGLAVGPGRGDGINRIYVIQFIGHLYEFTYIQ